MATYKVAAALAAALIAGGCATVPEPAATPRSSHIRSFSESPSEAEWPPGWRPWTLSRFKTPTRYRLVHKDGRRAVMAIADRSASALAHPLDLDPETYPLLSWQWKVSELISSADNSRSEAEDSPVRVLVTFDGDLGTLPLGERIFADNFRLATGRPLPYATLMYIWENQARENTVIANRYTSRIQMIVVRSGRAGLGAWQSITRNVADDYRRAFGEAPGRVSAVAIMTDTDNTGEQTAAYYGDVRFRRDPAQREISSAR